MVKVLPVADAWYEIQDICGGISRILETHVASWMRCNMWLVRGRDRDLLIDTGMGLRPLRAEIGALRGRPVAAVCTHCHFDHIGCSHEFDVRLGHRAEADVHAAPGLDETCARAWIAHDLLTALPHEGYSLADYRLTPAPLTGYLDEGDVLDTGDRVFNILHAPGHSPGSIALYEKATRTLFSGDLLYDGQLIDNAWHSDKEAYRASLARLLDLPIEVVHAGHEASFGRERLVELVTAYLRSGSGMGDVGDFIAGLAND